MESPYYEMTHDFEQENRDIRFAYHKGYMNGYFEAAEILEKKISEQREEIIKLQLELQNLKTMQNMKMMMNKQGI